ncbi:hypothetical protein PN441_04635 [Spirulina major CS-329]|nr:hypothetical protein [Spirulina subsalsa]MDB9502349.1 hypothetical protein [Spirulina major CS-329]
MNHRGTEDREGFGLGGAEAYILGDTPAAGSDRNASGGLYCDRRRTSQLL